MSTELYIDNGFTAQEVYQGHLILTDGKTVIAINQATDQLTKSVAIRDNSYAETLATLKDKINQHDTTN